MSDNVFWALFLGAVVVLGILTVIPIPSPEGKTLSEYEAALEESGHTLGEVTYEYSDTVPAGDVISAEHAHKPRPERDGAQLRFNSGALEVWIGAELVERLGKEK